MNKKAITLQQLEEALRDLARWIRDELRGYVAEPEAEGKSGYVLTTNGAGGRSWEPGGAVEPDASLSQTGVAADAAAVGTAIAAAQAAAESAQEAAERAQDAAERAQTTADAVTPAGIGAEERRLQFSDVAVETFTDDGTYADFPYRAAVALEGVTAGMLPEVVFSVEDAMSGVFAPAAESFHGGVYIYAAEMPEAMVTIPTIVLWR